MRPRDDIIALLNEYFDTLAEPIEQHGGQILKFMGDGLLAIFPHNAPAAFRAVEDICIGMTRVNAWRTTSGRPPLEFGIGCNYGDVMYGNIGSRKRLDFTVIGPAVNIAARPERLSKELESTVLFLGAFAARADCGHRLQRRGSFPLRGVGEPVAVFSLAEVRTPARARRSRPTAQMTRCSTAAERCDDVSSRRGCDRLAPAEHLSSHSESPRTVGRRSHRESRRRDAWDFKVHAGALWRDRGPTRGDGPLGAVANTCSSEVAAAIDKVRAMRNQPRWQPAPANEHSAREPIGRPRP
jgi:class 3 adenylate cyclase